MYPSLKNVKLKKGTIYKDGTEFLSYEKKSNGTELVVYKLNSKDELFTAIFYPGEVEDKNDNYYKLLFINEDMSLEYSRAYWNKSLIKWLLEQGVLSEEGEINKDKLEVFIKKYDENISEQTIRIRN